MAGTTYTLDNVPMRKGHYFAAAYTIVGNITNGYYMSLIGIALTLIIPVMDMNATWQGLIGSSGLLGILFGSLIGGTIADKTGRRKIYYWHNILLIICCAAMFFVNTPAMLFALRLLGGVICGFEYATGPTMTSEFSPVKKRGTICACLVIGWALGALLAYVVCYALVDVANGWRWMLASAAVPAAIALIFIPIVPESFRWQISHGKIEEAREGVKKYFGADVSIEEDIARLASPKAQAMISGSPYKELFGKKYIKRTLFGGIFWICQVIPYFAISTYQPTALSAMGVEDAYLGSLIINVFVVLGSIAGALIVDRVKRKKFCIITFILVGVPCIIFGIVQAMPPLLVTGLFCLTMFFLFMAQLLQNIYPAELFPTHLRGAGVGVCTAISRVGSAFGTFLFPLMIAGIGINMSMLVMGIICAIGVFFAVIWAPETRGVNLDAVLEEESAKAE